MGACGTNPLGLDKHCINIPIVILQLAVEYRVVVTFNHIIGGFKIHKGL